MTMRAYDLETTSSTNDASIQSWMKEIYETTADITQDRWAQQSIDTRFYAGDQSVWEEIYSKLPAAKRKQLSFNQIMKIVNMVSGYQRRNRKSLNVIPIEGSDEKTANQLSKTLIWLNNQQNMSFTASDAFLGALITGMNLLSVWVDYRNDPMSGDIQVDNIGYNGYLIDPNFKKTDLSDCDYIWTRRFPTNKRAASLLPEHSEEILEMRNESAKDGYFSFLPESMHQSSKNLVAYDEFWYRDSRKATILVDKDTEEVIEWSGDNENLALFMQRYPQLRKQTIQKQTCKLCICVNNRVMYNGKNPYNIDRYPFVPVLGYYNPDLPYYESRIQGMVRPLRDSNFVQNRMTQIILDIIESQVNSGLKVMEDSLVSDKDAFKSGQGQVLFVKKDAPLGLGSIEKVQPAEASQSIFQIMEIMKKSSMEISGVNEELLGSAEDDKAGILSMLRQGAGLTTLQILFDHFDESMKLLGNLEIDLIQSNFREAKIRRIIEEDPTPDFKNKSFQKYDCVVIEGCDTASQKMLAFKQKLYLKEIGIPIPTEDLLADATFQNKNETIEKIVKQEQEQAQMQQQQAQMQMKQLEAQANLANARAQADQGLAIERTSRVSENQALAVERRAESIADLERASLDKIKAVKELATIDLTQFEQLLSIVERLRGHEGAVSAGLGENNEQTPQV